MDKVFGKKWRDVVFALIIANTVSVVLYLLRVAATRTYHYEFLLWNLFLGWLPVLFAVLLVRHLQKNRWLSFGGIALTLLWLGFLPNSFYIVSDLIHLRATGEIGLLFDTVLFVSCIINAFIAGFISMVMVHKLLQTRTKPHITTLLMSSVIFLCSFAIYLGRFLRWNSWDMITSPIGLLFDITDPVINPGIHPQAFVTTATFFMLIGSSYLVVWSMVCALDGPSSTRRKSSKKHAK